MEDGSDRWIAESGKRRGRAGPIAGERKGWVRRDGDFSCWMDSRVDSQLSSMSAALLNDEFSTVATGIFRTRVILRCVQDNKQIRTLY